MSEEHANASDMMTAAAHEKKISMMMTMMMMVMVMVMVVMVMVMMMVVMVMVTVTVTVMVVTFLCTTLTSLSLAVFMLELLSRSWSKRAPDSVNWTLSRSSWRQEPPNISKPLVLGKSSHGRTFQGDFSLLLR